MPWIRRAVPTRRWRAGKIEDPMSLKEKLDALREKGLQDESVKQAYEAFVSQLTKAGTADLALKPGDPMPAFVLPNAEGRLIVSDELRAVSALVVNFFRGDWCPYCRTMLQAYEAALPTIVEAGGRLVTITPDTGAASSTIKRKHGLHFDVLSDPDCAIALQFGVAFRTPKLYGELLRSRGLDLANRHGNSSWFIPMPATFVVDRDGIVRDAFTDVDFTHRAEPDAIVAALRRLKTE
jgi:peroxiredoxin